MGGSQLVVCVLTFGLVLLGTTQGQPVGAPAVNGGFAPAPAPVKSAPTPAPAVTGPPSYLAINCGGLTPANVSIPQYYGGVTYGFGNGTFYQPNNSHVSTAPAGKGDIVFLADRYYYGTSTKPRQYLDYAPLNTADGALYLTERYGLSFTYELDLPNGAYNVDLFFAETQFNQVGARIFSVTIQGVKSVPNLDIYATVGANKSLIVTRQATVSNGLLSILFETVSSNVNDGEAKVNAIRVYTNSSTNVPFPAPPTSYFVDAGASGSRVTADGVNYTRDSYFSNGVAVAFTSAGAPSPLSVAQTTDPIVYSTARVGPSFSYYFNLPVGHYRVDLEFVEGQFTQPGQRLFTVEIQGVQAFPVIDIIANSSYALSPAPAPAPGPASYLYTPTSFNLTTAAAVSNGLLRIDFNGTNGGNATVSAIKVTPLNANTNGTIAIDCGSPIDVVTGNGVIFQADTNYSAASYSVQSNPYQVFLPYNDAVDDFLYPTVRQGNFTYNFSLPNGTYLVTLYFADLNATGPGQRIFDVYIQEVKVLSQLDVYAKTGGAITVFITQFPANVTSRFLSIRFQSSPNALSLPNVAPQNYVLGGTNYVNTLYPPFVSALFIQPGVPPASALAPAPAPAKTIVAQAPRPIGPPPPPGAPDPYFAYVNTPADLPQGPVPPVPTFGGAASANPSCPANGAPPQAVNCTGPCPLWSPPFPLNVAVNAAGPRYVSSCGIVFEDDSSNATRCDSGDVIPQGARWCRTNIKGPQGGYQYSTSEGIFNTSDPTVFQSEFIGYNTYKFRLPSPGIYQVYSYFAEISGDDPVINVNRPGLRIFYIHFNGNNADAIGPIDPFVLAGDQKFHAVPAIGRGVQCNSNELSIQYEAVAAGRDAPAIKGIWVYGPVDSNFNAMAPLSAQAPGSSANSVMAPPPPVGVSPSVTSGAAPSGAPTPAATPSGS